MKERFSESVEKVNTGGKLVNESGETLNEIVDSVKKVGDIISEIAASSQEQATGIEEVNKAVTQMDEITQQNAALAEETSAASESSLHKATDMNGIISFFTLTGSQSGGAYAYDAPAVVQSSTPSPEPKQSAPVQSQVSGGPATSVDDDKWEEF